MNSIPIINGIQYPPFSEMGFSEIKKDIRDESGFHMELHEVFFGQVNLKWAKYNNPNEKVIAFCPQKNTIVSHFRIADPASIIKKNKKGISQGQFVLYNERPEPYEIHVAPTMEKWCSFFELGLPEDIFYALFGEQNDFLFRFNKCTTKQILSFDFTASIHPKMHAIINEMNHTSFRGHLKGIYLEAKTIELFLLQIEQLDKSGCSAHTKLKTRDIESLHEIKQYLERNFDQPTSIAALSREAGINSMKLKTGFKQLFNTTVFGYLHTIRMQEAKRLLLDENLYVNEVAEKTGYRYPHHFSAAFKKEFSISPGQLRR